MTPPSIIWIGVVEAAIHEERVRFDPGEGSAFLRGVRQGAQREVIRGDVVANAKDNPAFDVFRNLPQIVVRVSIPYVAIVVVAAGNATPALRRGFVEGGLHSPPELLGSSFGFTDCTTWPNCLTVPLPAPLGPGLPTIASASIRVVVLVDGAPALLLDILRLRTVVLATLLRLLGENGDVVPRRWVPVGIIIPLLRRLNYYVTAVKHLTTQNSSNAPAEPTEFSSA